MTEIENKKDLEKIDDVSSSSYKEIIEKYFQKYKSFFPNDQAKAIFLGGALTGFLLEIQRIRNPQKSGTEAFWRSLHALNIDARIFKNLFPKVVEKLKMYNIPYSGFVQITSEYIQKAGDFDALERLEVSWFFTHGLASYQNLRRKKVKEDSK